MEVEISVVGQTGPPSAVSEAPRNGLLRIDMGEFQQFLEKLLPLVLGDATKDELESLFDDVEFVSNVTKWASDPNVGVVYIVKNRNELDAQQEQEDSATVSYSYSLVNHLEYSPNQASTLALIKHVAVLDSSIPLASQLHMLNLFGPAATMGMGSSRTASGAGVYEGLHRLVHWGVAPAFEAYVENKARKGNLRLRVDDNKENDSKMGIPMTKRKFAELELSLLHLQQNVEIPEITLSVHPAVTAIIAKAQTLGVRPSVDMVDAHLFSDSSFLNRLQGEVNNWIKEIQNVTQLNRDVASGTASQEINFWLSMERALEGIEEQLRSIPITLTLDILKHAKRFHATVSFIADTGLREATDVVQKYNQLMKDFPLNELLAATDLTKIHDSLLLIFAHTSRKLKLSPYPIRRALPLVEAISRDLNEQLAKVLSSQRPMFLDYASFERAMTACATVFQAWDDNIKEFTNVAREVTRKRSEKFIPIKINPAHAKLQARVTYLRQFRKQHNQLQIMVGPLGIEASQMGGDETAANTTLKSADLDMDMEVRQAYECVIGVEVLDVSPEGTDIWVSAESAYNDKVGRVENQIISRLRDRLGGARNANEMFRVFSKFNALFVRPKIRGAIAEYQTQLIDSVKEDIRLLHDKFKKSYQQSEAYHMSQLRDHPPISGAVVWAKQIERQLSTYMKRVEDVLGKGWELYAEGQKLQSESQSFRRKLDTRPIYEAWLLDINRRSLQISGHLFDISRSRSQGSTLQISVNFDPQVITLFKEVRNLLWLGYQVPHTVSNTAKDAKRVYPHAVSLAETLRTYSYCVSKANDNPGIASLIAEYRSEAQQQITRGMGVRWEHFVNIFDARHHHLPQLGVAATEGSAGKHALYVRELANAVSVLQERTDNLVDIYTSIMTTIERLATCAYSSEAFSPLLESVQKTIDQLNLEGYVNLESWVQELDKKIEVVLLKRLRSVIDRWCKEFEKDDQQRDNHEAKLDKIAAHKSEQPTVNFLTLKTVVHEIRMQNQVIYLDPPLEQARSNWYHQLQQWLNVICSLERIQSSRYEIGLKVQSATLQERTYATLLGRFFDGTLNRCFTSIEDKVDQVGLYVKKWLRFQSLWDLEADYVYSRVGESLSGGQQLLLEIRKSRNTFDNSETRRSFGTMIVDYEQVQSKVNLKYDAWQRDILGRFGQNLGNAMKERHASIQKARQDLERYSIDNSSTSATVSFITIVQDLKRKIDQWSPEIQTFSNSQKTLERQRFQFPQDWLHIEQVEGEWGAFKVILARRDASIQEQFAGLQLKITSEDKIVQDRIQEVVSEWEAKKPIQGSLNHETAMNSIKMFETKVVRLKEEHATVSRAKEALDLELVDDGRLEPVLEEIRDLKAVWIALSGVWAQIAELREKLWTTVQARSVRQQLEALLESTRQMPSRMRQYAAFEHVQEMLRQLLKSNPLITELKSEAFRERHWRQLYKGLRVATHYSMSSATLGSVWDLDLKRNEVVIKEAILQAQGEMALEEFLKQVKETWTSYTLDLVNYQNKTRLIRGWDDLFLKCSENLSSLSSMKLSPYYKVFEEDAAAWEERLNRIHLLFDVWIDVQRQWVYLEGIFSGSADIKHLLPVESQRFSNINAEFLTVLKKVFKSPFVMDVLNIPGIQKSLERLADLLSKIQKALGEYLERERASFPRFYFVGDEDLLEIIGNSKDLLRVGKFLKKMFGGLSAIELNDDMTRIEGMASREGEVVMFNSPIILKDYPRINDWLTRLESEMKVSLALSTAKAYEELQSFFFAGESPDIGLLMNWIANAPGQLVILCVQIRWTAMVEEALKSSTSLKQPLTTVLKTLEILADIVLQELSPIQRQKCEHLITELVHERDVLRSLLDSDVKNNLDFKWLYHMRFYLNLTRADPLDRLEIRMAGTSFSYGFEYLGIPDRLVQTPLTDRCYLTLTQALHARLGGSPFGPAGTGKTESVKALGLQLGRLVFVFCCDETFDFQAMGRIFVGLCQVGAWGCFDEFNRLEERILSAVSQQIQSIQLGLGAAVHDNAAEIELVGRRLRINSDTGIFITMNPGYAGRSNLPDNLKKLFRSIAMTRPDRELIAQVMLFSQGFRSAECLASKIVPFFNLCQEQLSSQPHYDFGLRALKSVLISAGHLKRERLRVDLEKGGTFQTASAVEISEQEILIMSVRETIVPKLVADDVPLLKSLLSDVVPGVKYVPVDLQQLRDHIKVICAEQHLVVNDSWTEKVLQLYQIQNIQHGIMMVGPSASGKSTAWRVLFAALERLTGVEGVTYVIDPKSISKESLYGTLDSTTREWNDGLFTHILRKIVDDVRSESTKTHWVIFDGDVDPEWVENLNSVLDDNKLLTLPNGERLSLPPNVRIMFEVESLKYATLATVSRCGIVWFSEDVVSPAMLFRKYIDRLSAVPLDALEEEVSLDVQPARSTSNGVAQALQQQSFIAKKLENLFAAEGLICKTLDFARSMDHIMEFTVIRAVESLFSLLSKAIRNVLDYNSQHTDFHLRPDQVEMYIYKRLLIAIVWAFGGDSKLQNRAALGDYIREESSIEMPPLSAGGTLIDFDVGLPSADWVAWETFVPTIEIETHAVLSADVVIPTVDTIRHEEVLYSWLSEHRPVLLCGPPGSGKTMSLTNALRKLPDLEVVSLNFSSATTPDFILKTIEQHCEYRKTPSGTILGPGQIGRWLVLFCDEINLPAMDKYGTQRVISFLRQIVERGGFWRTSDKAWIKLENIQFVGACNPPTDPGRVPLTQRFLRHVPIIMVDYPGDISLTQIYGTFNRAALKVLPPLRGYSESLTSAMIEFYVSSQSHFTTDMQAHYVYSPRELTRWVRGIYEAIRPLDTLSLEGLVRLWAHEGLRLFQDRLVNEEERRWTDHLIDQVAGKFFPNVNQGEALARPILYSNWTSKYYIPVDRDQLRTYTKARLRVFYEEELDVPLVLFNNVLDHVLRIDRAFRQTQGHMLLIGVSGSGKTTLSRFVAWMNGLSVFQIKVHNKYTAVDFDDDLRAVLRRAGCKGEKIAFILDESNVLEPGFLERMNTVLANAEVPGLFEGDEYTTLLTACKEGAQRDGIMLDTPEELYKWFTQQIARNLHVVFTMNPPADGLASRSATSPALFNRCVLDWFGDWSDQALYQVATEFTNSLDLDIPSYEVPSPFPIFYRELSMPPDHRSAIMNALVFVHLSMRETNAKLTRRQGRLNYVTPRDYLEFINQYVKLFNEKRMELEEQQRHLNVGLDKLHSTVAQVGELRHSLAKKRSQLEAKSAEANDKLKRMVADQQDAEQKKLASIQIQAALEVQKKTIAERTSLVMSELADAEPAVVEAQAAVSNIKKQHLTEVRSMANPPEAVKLAMESVCTALGFKIDSWKTVQSIIRRDDFITSIVNFDTTKSMNRQLREKMKAEYLSRPSFNFETVNRASKACGPLCKWVIAQVNYSDILDSVGPLRKEVQSLEDQAFTTTEQASTIITMISELEARIASYKDEYAFLISETQAIKAEMERVQKRVDRSITLLDSLKSEKERWVTGSKSFEAQMSTVPGDVLLSAAFLAYSGYFDQQYRESMWQGWCSHLKEAGIKFKSDLALSEYLSTTSDRLSWQAKSLPADEVCTQNAIILKRFERFPLMIDPSGQAVNFLLQEYKERKINVTSFLDSAFLKNLESALRFGTPILIQDVEYLDPILNTILNKELRRAGGRVLIRLGNQEIDYSPTFTMFLSTRDPSVDFAADLNSRVNIVNFSITRASLQAQSLNQVLRAERPDIDLKRSNLLKLQGEFRNRLYYLEGRLLSALNESDGNILDDDKVIETLETLKREAADVAAKVEETDGIIAVVEQVTREYLPLAYACSAVFFVLDELSLLHHFYQFSLHFFLDIFEFVLFRNPSLAGVTDPHQRQQILLNDLFLHAFKRTSRALLHSDHITFAVLLAQVRLRGTSDFRDDEFAVLLDGGEELQTEKRATSVSNFLNDTQGSRLQALVARLPCFQELIGHIERHSSEWRSILRSNIPENQIPVIWSGETGACHAIRLSLPEIDQVLCSDLTVALRNVLVIKCLRPDRLIPALGLYSSLVFNRDLFFETNYDLGHMVKNELGCATPVCLASVPGFDASYRVDALAASSSAKCASIAMGSQEGFALANQAIAAAARTGTWVLLKNVHLAPTWLSQLEKRLQTLNPNEGFRLFLTMETSPNIPVNILRLGRVIMNEPPPGIRANILESLSGIAQARLSEGPAEKTRLYFLLAWFHAVVQERLRYAPLGWSKFYEFNDSDLKAAFDTIDTWMKIVANGKLNVDPAKIPWEALRSLIKECAYGGKVDSEFDQTLLDSFVDFLFTAKSYDFDFHLVSPNASDQGLLIPDATRLDQFEAWVKTLPEQEPPSYLSLPPLVERVLGTSQGASVVARILKMRSLSDDDETVALINVMQSEGEITQPSWMRTVQATSEKWLAMLPKTSTSKTTGSSSDTPLQRFVRREESLGSELLRTITCDLQEVIRVCKGEMKQTNKLRALLSDLTKGSVPKSWRLYKSKEQSAGPWMADYIKRLEHLANFNLNNKTVSLGLLFHPHAFITASRQTVAQATNTSLEQLIMRVDISASGAEGSFTIEDLTLAGAEWSPTGLILNDGSLVRLPPSQLSWEPSSSHTTRRESETIGIPCWLDSTRAETLFTVCVPKGDVEPRIVAQRAVAIIAAS